jgi:hypothetical protein
MQSKVIAIDFDGTIVSHEYPKIVRPNPRAFGVMDRLQEEGHKLILWTMRSGAYLDEAVEFCSDHGLTFWDINQNPEQLMRPASRKVFADLYIDAAALGCPTKFDQPSNRNWVNWRDVEGILIRTGYLTS